MAVATVMYHSEKNPLKKVGRDSKRIQSVRGIKRRRIQRAFLRYHDPYHWPALLKASEKIGHRDLTGNGPIHLVPTRQPPQCHHVVKNNKGKRPFRTK